MLVLTYFQMIYPNLLQELCSYVCLSCPTGNDASRVTHEIMGCVMMLSLKDFQPELYSQHYTTGSPAPQRICKVHADVFF